MPRPPKLLKDLIAGGTFRTERHLHRFQLPSTSEGLGEPPAWLGEFGIAEWERVTKDPVYGPTVHPAHAASFAQYCFLHDKNERYMRGFEGAKALGATEFQGLLSLRMQFGLTPASSAKLVKPATAPVNKFAKVG